MFLDIQKEKKTQKTLNYKSFDFSNNDHIKQGKWFQNQKFLNAHGWLCDIPTHATLHSRVMGDVTALSHGQESYHGVLTYI